MSSPPKPDLPLPPDAPVAETSRSMRFTAIAACLVLHLVAAAVLYTIGASTAGLIGGLTTLGYIPAFALAARDRWADGLTCVQLTSIAFVFGGSLLLADGGGFQRILIPLAALPWVLLPAGGTRQKVLVATPLIAFGIRLLVPDALVEDLLPAEQALSAETTGVLLTANTHLALVMLLGLIWKIYTRLGQTEAMLAYERRRFFGLMMEMMPRQIALQLLAKPGVLAEQHPHVTVLFADLVGFTSWAAKQHPVKVVTVLNWIFSRFDQACEVHGVTKIKTIGDCYMAAAGLPVPGDGNTPGVAQLALDMRAILKELCKDHKLELKLRIGLHVGPVVAGVIGERGYRYDLWGDSVNVASRMESHGESGRIQVSEPVFERLEAAFKMTARGQIKIKGKQGQMSTWWLEDSF